MLWVTPQIGLREEELAFTATLASGPGGQYVNRTASAVRLAFDVRRSPALPEGVRRRLVPARQWRLPKHAAGVAERGGARNPRFRIVAAEVTRLIPTGESETRNAELIRASSPRLLRKKQDFAEP